LRRGANAGAADLRTRVGGKEQGRGLRRGLAATRDFQLARVGEAEKAPGWQAAAREGAGATGGEGCGGWGCGES
jgi:hypothetical protein